jgi:hypothetical protein
MQKAEGLRLNAEVGMSRAKYKDKVGARRRTFAVCIRRRGRI